MRARIFTRPIVTLGILTLAVGLPSIAPAHQKNLLPGLGGPLCNAEERLAPTSPNPRTQKLKDLVRRLSGVLSQIQGGDTRYARWIHGLWAHDHRTTMEMWGYRNDKKYRQFAEEVNRLAFSPLYFNLRDTIGEGLQTLIQIQAGGFDPDKVDPDPLLLEYRLAVQVVQLTNSIQRALRNSPDVRRLWLARIEKRLSLPPDQRPDSAIDTIDLRANINAKAKDFLSVPGAPSLVSASRGLGDHAFVHFANGLVGFGDRDLMNEFFVREMPTSVVRGHLDLRVVMGVFLSVLAQENGRVRSITQTSIAANHSEHYRKFEFSYQFPGYSTPHKFHAVICWNPAGCFDRDGSKFLFGDIVTLYPRCGPDVYWIPGRDVFQSQIRSGMLDQGFTEKYIEHCK